jgi:hypothetical protein
MNPTTKYRPRGLMNWLTCRLRKNRPTKETAQILRDELLFQRATQTYLWSGIYVFTGRRKPPLTAVRNQETLSKSRNREVPRRTVQMKWR